MWGQTHVRHILYTLQYSSLFIVILNLQPEVFFLDRMCGPKTRETKLDNRFFGFPFDRNINFNIYNEE